MNIPKIPVGDWIETLESWLQLHFGFFFDFVKTVIGGVVSFLEVILREPPAIIIIVIITALVWWLAKWRLGVFSLIGLLFIVNLGYWDPAMQTLALVLTAALISILLGVPIGILSANYKTVRKIITPLLDFMQTMPAFVYLLPAITFFSVGVVPGVISSIIFAIPPTIRLTILGIKQVPEELVEAADAFGSTSVQKLFKLQLPMALPTIMAGINQTIMLSLSMVVIASMIGAQGIGTVVFAAVTQTKTGVGFEGGLVIVILAILLDRVTQNLIKKKTN
ncbi:ABC transporter permease [Paenibacillus endoradicis]|uniref:ABC transporter permease n=1 Tax=Paenibacillus endoradicis TaxID=2972487 RepID=UPI002158CD1F|nr:proline/glycine betaine ABC transporter permease [Paenibacillus endoradicis]MCR8657650.1 proline/glycine betaine ABC transporter permease [Paenibacillus endoradicis]